MKMSSSKKMTCKGTLRQVYLSEAKNPIPPALTHCIRVIVYSILIHTGKGGRQGELTREKATVHKMGRK
jgi:hypothetical protein